MKPQYFPKGPSQGFALRIDYCFQDCVDLYMALDLLDIEKLPARYKEELNNMKLGFKGVLEDWNTQTRWALDHATLEKEKIPPTSSQLGVDKNGTLS
jgi:hypothetical protein